MRTMTSTDTLTYTASEAVGFVTVSCVVSLDGTFCYDIVLHQDETHASNARCLTYAEAHEYMTMLLDQYSLAHEVPIVLARVTAAARG